MHIDIQGAGSHCLQLEEAILSTQVGSTVWALHSCNAWTTWLDLGLLVTCVIKVDQCRWSWLYRGFWTLFRLFLFTLPWWSLPSYQGPALHTEKCCNFRFEFYKAAHILWWDVTVSAVFPEEEPDLNNSQIKYMEDNLVIPLFGLNLCSVQGYERVYLVAQPLLSFLLYVLTILEHFTETVFYLFIFYPDFVFHPISLQWLEDWLRRMHSCHTTSQPWE